MTEKIRVLYSFPHKLGAGRICHIAWQQVQGVSAAGATVVAWAGALSRPVDDRVEAHCSLARGRFRIPYKAIGHARAYALHDYLVSRWLAANADRVDIVHVWPQGGLRTLAIAAKLGLPTVLERPNTHTRYAFEVVQRECDRLGVKLPANFEHSYDQRVLDIEEEEFRRAFRLLCPSDFVMQTFLDRGFPREQLVRHMYGFDTHKFWPRSDRPPSHEGLKVLFVGMCAVRKGLHFALEAWLKSPASQDGTFLIAGEFLPAYRERLAAMLAHPSVNVLGHRDDVPELMRNCDVMVLPSLEEGFALVCTEAMGSGCVPVVSTACTELCRHLENSLVHEVGDVATLAEHLTLLWRDRVLLEKLRDGGLKLAPYITWQDAGRRLLEIYREAIAAYQRRPAGRTSVDLVECGPT